MWNKYNLRGLSGSKSRDEWFLCDSFYGFLMLMGIVSWLLTVDGLAGRRPSGPFTLSCYNRTSTAWFITWCNSFIDWVIRAHIFLKGSYFPQTQHLVFFPLSLSALCRILGRLVGLVLSLLSLQGMTCISCCSAPFPPNVNHLRCGHRPQQGADPYNHTMANNIPWGLETSL